MTSKNQLALQGHLVICGWKNELPLLIGEILKANTQWTLQDVVVIAKVPSTESCDFHVIHDDHFSEEALKQACIQTAAKAIVLADWSDKNETATETDAKTVMAAMAIEKLAPHVHVITELLDLEFIPYLKMANVDEIIYSREYSRILLASVTSDPGITHVIYDMLRTQIGSDLLSLPVPHELVGKTFGDLCRHLNADPVSRMICIGLFENTQNIHVLKKQALIEAQKNPEIRSVLRNLSHVREIECNKPNINPGDDYIILQHSSAIILREPHA